MDSSIAIDLYCERLGPGFWAEPINAFTNLAFVVAAFAAWRLADQDRSTSTISSLLIGLMVAIGVGSGLFHTVATGWTRVLDVIPILLFQVTYLWFYGRRIIHVRPVPLFGMVVVFLIAAYLGRQFPHVLNGSLIYLPVFLLLPGLGLYHYYHARTERTLLLWAAAVFTVALLLRSIDLAVCDYVPTGTHFFWHLFNGLLVYLAFRALIMNMNTSENENRQEGGLSNDGGWLYRIGRRQVPVWFESSVSVTSEFQTIGKKLKILRLIPNPFPFYDWIMGFYERESNREALRGPMLEQARRIVDVGAGTGYLLSRLVRATREDQEIVAVDLSRQMLKNSESYLSKHQLLTPRTSFIRSDCRNLPYEDNTFDLYVSSYLFDLLPEAELRHALREMKRVLVPDGYAILITMTTELDDIPWLSRTFYRLMNEFYCLGYHKGRWNPIWRSLFAGYAPHCRPIALGTYLRELEHMVMSYTKVSRVSLFPVRIYYVRKSHG